MEPALMTAASRGKAVTTTGWILIVLGLVAILFPHIAGAGVTIAIGFALLLGGVGATMAAWRHREDDGFAPVVVSALMALAGLLFLFRPWVGMQVLTLMLIIYFGAIGLLRLLAGFQLRPQQGWGWLAFDGALSFLLGLWLWTAYPAPAPWLLGLLVGIQLLFSGLVMVVTGKAVRDIAGAIQDEIDAEGEKPAEVLDSGSGSE